MAIPTIPICVPLATGAPLAADYDCIAEQGRPCCGLRAGTTGTIALKMATGATISIKSVWQGESIWLQAAEVLKSGTSVQDLLIYFDAQ